MLAVFMLGTIPSAVSMVAQVLARIYEALCRRVNMNLVFSGRAIDSLSGDVYFMVTTLIIGVEIVNIKQVLEAPRKSE